MKILAISDIHCEFNRFSVDKLPNPNEIDVVFIAGDMTNYGMKRDSFCMYKCKEWMRSLRDTYGSVYFIFGNHSIGCTEKNFMPNEPGNTCIMDKTVDIMGYKVHGVSLTECYDYPDLATDWDYMTCNEEYAKAAWDFGYADIILSHWPPYKCCDQEGWDLMTGSQIHLGSCVALDYILTHKPKLFICGHLHGSGGKQKYINNTLVVNTACQYTLIELER